MNYFQCNLANHHDIEDVVKRIQAEVRTPSWLRTSRMLLTSSLIMKVGHPTILINNAGVVQGKLLLDLTRDELEQCVPRSLVVLESADLPSGRST